jgi:peptide methionine sulfoxide reductase MsrA
MLPASAGFLLDVFFDPEVGCNMILRNVLIDIYFQQTNPTDLSNIKYDKLYRYLKSIIARIAREARRIKQKKSREKAYQSLRCF